MRLLSTRNGLTFEEKTSAKANTRVKETFENVSIYFFKKK